MRLEDKLSNNNYRCKNFLFQLSDLDEGTRQVKGYFSTFDNLDSDGDVIRQGAFSKSITESGPNATGNRRIAHLRDHDFTHQIGRLDELGEDTKGLYFVSTLGRSTKGSDALADYQDGIIREHSIGFQYIADKMDYVEPSDSKFDSERGHFEIREVKLWEGSAVTFGANELTPVVDVAKGLNSTDMKLKRIQELTETLENALKNGKGTDERLENIEQMFAQLKQLQNSLELKQPSIKDTVKEDEPKAEADKLTYINFI